VRVSNDKGTIKGRSCPTEGSLRETNSAKCQGQIDKPGIKEARARRPFGWISGGSSVRPSRGLLVNATDCGTNGIQNLPVVDGLRT
jgi:hypothetical protein